MNARTRGLTLPLVENGTIPATLRSLALREPDRPCWIDPAGGSSLTFGQLLEYSGRVANILWAMGSKAGDRVGLWLPVPQAIFCYFGALLTGSVVSLSAGPPGDVPKKWLLDFAPKFLLAGPDGARFGRSLNLAGLREVLAFGGRDEAPGTVNGDRLLGAAPPEPGVELSLRRIAPVHQGLMNEAVRLIEEYDLGPDDLGLSLLNPAERPGTILAMMVPLAAACSVMTLERPTPSLAWRTLVAHHVTWLAAHPEQLLLLLKVRPGSEDFLSLRLQRIICTDSPGAGEVQRELSRHLGLNLTHHRLIPVGVS